MDLLKHHYEIEKGYAKKILASKKHSKERSKLFKEGYDEITKIIDKNPLVSGETDYTDLVVKLISEKFNKNSHIFDLGCASGNLIFNLLSKGFKSSGIDVSEVLINKAKLKLKSISSSHLVEKIDIMNFKTDNKFDCIVLDNVIEHFHPDSIKDILDKCHSLLNHKGCILILTPHRFSGPHDISGDFLKLGDKAQGFHLKEFTFTELNNALINSNFKNVYGFPFHPRLTHKINIIPKSSQLSTKKALYLEKLFRNTSLIKLTKLNTSLTRALVALFFPCVCFGEKR